MTFVLSSQTLASCSSSATTSSPWLRVSTISRLGVGFEEKLETAAWTPPNWTVKWALERRRSVAARSRDACGSGYSQKASIEMRGTCRSCVAAPTLAPVSFVSGLDMAFRVTFRLQQYWRELPETRPAFRPESDHPCEIYPAPSGASAHRSDP